MLKNAHARDSRIQFVEEGHRYFIDGLEGYISTTTIVHAWFDAFDADAVIAKMMRSSRWSTSKYHGMTADAIKTLWQNKGDEAARLGTLMHERIEYFYNDAIPEWDALRGEAGLREILPEQEQFRAFQEGVVQKRGLIPYRTEWCVFDDVHKISGSIDMTYQVDPDDPNTLEIYDWKRTAELKDSNHFQCGKAPLEHLPDAKFWHYALQLNVYRYILETFYGKKIVGMTLVAMHPDRTRFEHRSVPRLQHEIASILELRAVEVRNAAKEANTSAGIESSETTGV